MVSLIICMRRTAPKNRWRDNGPALGAYVVNPEKAYKVKQELSHGLHGDGIGIIVAVATGSL